MNDLRVTLIQADLIWEDVAANLAEFERKMQGLEKMTDLVVLPEMFTTGFSLHADKLAEKMDGPTVRWMLEHANTICADIVGSIIIEENGNYYNRLIWARPSGKIFWYDKKHLFRYAGEDKVYTAGEKRLVVELKGWKIKPFICYDLRFPIWTRNIHNEYDLGVFIANWPKRRSGHWQTLLAARAIENQAYVIGVNRIGTDGTGLDYNGDSSVLDPQGRVLCVARGIAEMSTVSLSYSKLEDYRVTFPAWMDADSDTG